MSNNKVDGGGVGTWNYMNLLKNISDMGVHSQLSCAVTTFKEWYITLDKAKIGQ